MVTVATKVWDQSARLVRGADGILYALRGDTRESIDQCAYTARISTHLSAKTLNPVNADDYASARPTVDPGDYAAARPTVDPGDYAAARPTVDPGDYASARPTVDPGDFIAA